MSGRFIVNVIAVIGWLFAAAGLRLESWRPDPEVLFALVVGVKG